MKPTCSSDPNRITKKYHALEAKTGASRGYEQREREREREVKGLAKMLCVYKGQREKRRVNLEKWWNA